MSAVLLKKGKKHVHSGSVSLGVQVQRELPNLNDLTAEVVRPGDGLQKKGSSTLSLDCLTACYQNDLTVNPRYQPTHKPVHHPHQKRWKR